MGTSCDVLVIGGGIAGLSLASALAPYRRVVLLEAEPVFGYHTSSRSARQLIPSYGPPVVQALTRRTLELLDALQQHTGLALTAARSFMLVGREADVTAKASGSMERIDHAQALALCPQLRPESFIAAGLDATAVGTDTDALLDYHRRTAAGQGAVLVPGARVREATRSAGNWNVRAGAHTITAPVVVNAAGAWADPVASVFLAEPQQLVPYRRTAAIVSATHALSPQTPMVAMADDSFYFRHDDDGVLISPCENTRSIPGDAQAVPEEVAAALSLINASTTLGITGVRRSWTGLRTQAAHGLPVVGFDPVVEGFFWLAGQGGYGFQTSSAIAELATGLITGSWPDDEPAASALRPAVSGAAVQSSVGKTTPH